MLMPSSSGSGARRSRKVEVGGRRRRRRCGFVSEMMWNSWFADRQGRSWSKVEDLGRCREFEGEAASSRTIDKVDLESRP